MKVLGIIPARGGSKGIARKNLRGVAGRPLIAYTIEAVKQSRSLTRWVTSTDDEEIASTARALGSVVVRRPAALATDETPMVAVVRHVLDAVEPSEGRFDIVVVLQPTAPLRTAEDIDAAVRLLRETGADSVISVYEVHDHHPARMYRLQDGRLVPCEPEPPDRLRQGLAQVFHRNGAIYACRREVVEQGTLIGSDARPYVMPRERSVNIDDELDLTLAELLVHR